MKKVAIITNLYHTKSGGIEAYVSKLSSILIENGCEVHEFKTLGIKSEDVSKKVKGVIQHDISNGANFYRRSATKFLNDMVDKDEFDLIIGNSLVTKKLYNSKKFIQVQHMDHKFYDFWSGMSGFNFFNYVFLRIGYGKNPLKRDMTAFYNEMENVYGSARAIYPRVPLKLDMHSKSVFSKRKNIFWLGRLETYHKGLRNLNSIGIKFENIRIGGDGPGKKDLKDVKNNLIGQLNAEQIKKELSTSKVFIVTSKYEGFPLTIVESLSAGVPVILFDTFTSAKFFSKCESVFLINKNDKAEFIRKIQFILDMPEKDGTVLSKKAIRGRENNVPEQLFKREWLSSLGGNNE